MGRQERVLCFNSKLVRLKDVSPCIVGRVHITFQFQTGAIKSSNHSLQTPLINVSIPNWCD